MEIGNIILKKETEPRGDNVSLNEMIALLESVKYVSVEVDEDLLKIVGRDEKCDMVFRTVNVNEGELGQFC